jgi:hypothetical protein
MKFSCRVRPQAHRDSRQFFRNIMHAQMDCEEMIRRVGAIQEKIGG